MLSAVFALMPLVAIEAEPTVIVASKKFTESVILGEMATLLIRDGGTDATHRRELGGTRVLWNALVNGDIHLYAEYTGTLRQEILAQKHIENHEQLRRAVESYGLRMSEPLGFNNGYALGMTKPAAKRLGIDRISDLKNHPELALGFSNEFLNRGDGWQSLRDRYGLPQRNVTGIDHDLCYRGLAGDASVGVGHVHRCSFMTRVDELDALVSSGVHQRENGVSHNRENPLNALLFQASYE